MKRIAAIFNIWMISVLCPAGDGARIEKVDAYSSQVKSSVVIFYSGEDKLRFFAIDSADGLLTLDFPGVYSEFDFSGLSISQATQVSQTPLDPDASKGISVRFHLKPGVTYDVFDAGSGELTLLFEAGPVKAEPVAEHSKPMQEPALDSAPQFDDGENQRHVIAGRSGEGFLSEMVLTAGNQSGHIRLAAEGLVDYRQFHLENPDRFVLDLKQTAMGLENDELTLDMSLLKGVRIKQFQSAPDPVVRLVLDLNQRVETTVIESDGGLTLVYGADTAALQHRLAAVNAPNSAPEVVVAQQSEEAEDVSEEPEAVVEASPDEAMAAFASSSDNREAIESMEKVVDPVPSVMMDKQKQLDAAPAQAEATPAQEVIEAPIAENEIMQEAEARNEVVEEQPEEDLPVESLEEEVEIVAAEPAPQPVPESQPEEMEPASEEAQDVVVAESDQAASAHELSVSEEPQASENVATTVAAQETSESKEPEVESSQVVSEPVQAIAASEDMTLSSNEISEPEGLEESVSYEAPAPEETPMDEIVVTEPQADSGQQMETPPAGPVEETRVDHEMAAFATESVEAQHPEITEAGNLTESEPTPSVESAKPVFYDESQVAAIAPTEDQTETESVDDFAVPKFEMAGDIDREIKDFLDQEPDKSFYGMLKDVKARRRSTGPVVVTNSTIESSKLSEMRSMQEESSGEDDDVRFTKLFQESQDDLGVETLTGEEKEYKGFEISIIDVKDADVVDLLRFIADQVGLNLYVDSSVPKLSATYRFRNIPWDQALEIILANANLDKEFRNGVLRVATMDKFKDEERARQELREQREENVPRETVTFSLNYAKAEDVLPLVDNYLSKRGNILMDERTNMLIIQDIPNRMTTIRALIKKLDRMIDQVSIEARLVETSKRFLRELGIQWGLSAEYSPELGTETGLDFPNRLGVGGPNIGGSSPGGLQGGYAVNLPVVSENASGIGLTLGNFLDNFKLDVSLQMLESEGFGQIISSPKITTQNNKTALIKNGQKVPIQTIQRGTITVTYIDAVLELQVTPHITSDETVIMDVIVDKSEPDFTRTVDGNPVINIRRAETKVLVKNGGTAVIGGIFTLNEQSSEDGIPGLRKIPFLEKLFSHELKSYENQELLIFVTPRIVKY